MSPSDDLDNPEVWAEVDRITREQRSYAPFRERGARSAKEVEAVRDLLETLAAEADQEYSHPVLSPKDPPDCIAENSNGEAVAIEVTELVSEDAVRLNEQERRRLGHRPSISEMVMAQWCEQEFIEHIRERLAEKDKKKLNGGPYSEYIVLMHTDEPLLSRQKAEAWLATHSFGPFGQVSSAYFLFSYEPHAGYPAVRLRMKKE